MPLFSICFPKVEMQSQAFNLLLTETAKDLRFYSAGRRYEAPG